MSAMCNYVYKGITIIPFPTFTSTVWVVVWCGEQYVMPTLEESQAFIDGALAESRMIAALCQGPNGPGDVADQKLVGDAIASLCRDKKLEQAISEADMFWLMAVTYGLLGLKMPAGEG